MDKELAYPIELEDWKDPQGFVITQHVRDEAWTYFQCWTASGDTADFVGCLHFEGVWHMGSTRFSGLKGYPNVAESSARSYYLEVENSQLLERLASDRSNRDPDWRRYDRRDYKHYIVESHDFYLDLVASRVTFSRLQGNDAESLFRLWEQV